MAIKYIGLARFCRESKSKGLTPSDIFEKAVNSYGYDKELGDFKNYFYKATPGIPVIDGDRIPSYNLSKFSNTTIDRTTPITEGLLTNRDDINEIVTILSSRKKLSIIELCNELDIPPRRVEELVGYHRSKGLEIAIRGENIILSDTPIETDKLDKPLGDQEIELGIISDLHFGSTSVQITALNDFINECSKQGINKFVVAGDLVAGKNVYRGQNLDLYTDTSEGQESSIIVNLPEKKDRKYYVMCGNHDYNFMINGGHNIGSFLSSRREDIIYLGYDLVTVPILDGVDMILWHPSGGVPYAVSYRLQKGVEQIALEELFKISEGVKDKPTVKFVIAGHLHIQLQYMAGDIFCAQAGCFEGSTNYLKRKGLVPQVGGWILKASITKDGFLKSFDTKFKRYREIENDYLNYDHIVRNVTQFEKPIFEK